MKNTTSQNEVADYQLKLQLLEMKEKKKVLKKD